MSHVCHLLGSARFVGCLYTWWDEAPGGMRQLACGNFASTDQHMSFLPVQGYILLLLRSDASLLGLKYLTILIYTFLNPPIRHRYEETDHAGHPVV